MNDVSQITITPTAEKFTAEITITAAGDLPETTLKYTGDTYEAVFGWLTISLGLDIWQVANEAQKVWYTFLKEQKNDTKS